MEGFMLWWGVAPKKTKIMIGAGCAVVVLMIVAAIVG